MTTSAIDAVIVGAGPNGLATTIELGRAGFGVRILEASETAGGGCRSAELTLPGSVHDVCSTAHPLCFRDLIFARATKNSAEVGAYDANYFGGVVDAPARPPRRLLGSSRARNPPDWRPNVQRHELDSDSSVDRGCVPGLDRRREHRDVVPRRCPGAVDDRGAARCRLHTPRRRDGARETHRERPPHRAVMEGTSPNAPFRVVLAFASSGDSTRVEVTSEIRLRGAMRIVSPLVTAAYGRAWARGLAHLKELMESGQL